LATRTFIVPLRLAPFEPPLQIAHAQYLDFAESWAQGLAELLALLGELGIPRAGGGPHAAIWQGVQLKDARSIAAMPERLVSNWLAIDALPERMRFYDFKGGIALGKAQQAIKDAPLPVVAFNRGFLSFAALHELQEYFGPDLPLDWVAECSTSAFLEAGWPELRLAARDARPKFTDLTRQGLDRFFQDKGLKPFEVASGRQAWWPTAGRATTKKLSFDWSDGSSGLRQLVGKSNKRGFHWHYGVSCWALTKPVRHVRVAGRVIFTADGHSPIGDAKRLHRLRRSFCKNWRNDKWRDLLLTFWFWLADGASFIDVPMGEGAALRLQLPPLSVEAPFGIEAPDDNTPSSDDDGDEDGGASADDEGSADDPDQLDDEP
jgi:hypothetical protein